MASKTSTTGDFPAVWAIYKTFAEFLQVNVKGIETCFIAEQALFRLVNDFVSYTKFIEIVVFSLLLFNIVSLFTVGLRKRR